MITTDYRHLYLHGNKILVGTDVEAKTIYIDATHRKIDVLEIKEKAQKAIDQGKYLFWEIDFALSKLWIEDQARFFSMTLFLEEFWNDIGQHFMSHTLGVILFRGQADFLSAFLWTERHERLYAEKKEEYPTLFCEKETFCKRLFGADVFAEYLHRLASFLQEDVPVLCCLDVSALAPVEVAFLCTKERFPYMLLALKGTTLPCGHFRWDEELDSFHEDSTIGFCLPSLEHPHMNAKILSKLHELFKTQHSFRLIEERTLHESWDGLDEMIVFPEVVSSEGARKLRGFLAAGGIVTER